MRRHLTMLAALTASGLLMLAPLDAAADDSERLEALEERLMALEDEIEARDATIDAQRELLARHEPHVGQGSGLDAFFSTLEVGGYVSASYIYNFNRTPVASRLDGISQPLCQFNCRQNEFSFDAAKLELGRAAANPGDAGFQLDLLFGQNADILRSLSPDSDGEGSFSASDFDLFVQQAYVAYNWRGVEFKAGKFETLLGWELLDQPSNYNITQGILFTWAIPLYHTGVLASGQLTEEIGWALGLTNGFNNTIEGNDNKAAIGQLSYSSGSFFTSLSGYYGADGRSGEGDIPGSTDDLLILDYVASFEPQENLILWLNADYGLQESALVRDRNDPLGPRDSDGSYWGVALGGNLDVTERLSVALRGEYFRDPKNTRGTAPFPEFQSSRSADVTLISLTGTVKYQLTDNLALGSELRYDRADNDYSRLNDDASVYENANGDIFPDDDVGDFKDHDLYGLVNVTYTFD